LYTLQPVDHGAVRRFPYPPSSRKIRRLSQEDRRPPHPASQQEHFAQEPVCQRSSGANVYKYFFRRHRRTEAG
jgi:hypothetical protein